MAKSEGCESSSEGNFQRASHPSVQVDRGAAPTSQWEGPSESWALCWQGTLCASVYTEGDHPSRFAQD